MKGKKKKKLILLDGNAIIHRAYHALPSLITKKGELVNAIYGYTSTLLSVIEKFQPDYIVASFDLAAPTFRHKEYKEYKATRVKAPDELYQQIDKVKEITRAFGIPIYEKESYEADDIIGSLAKEVTKKHKNIEAIIVTGDLDTLQLVDNQIKVYTLSRGINQAVFYDKAAVIERFGILPEQLKDYKGLRGDASDNIPGVKGIGDKTAVKLLKEYKNLKNIYQHLDQINPTIRKKLIRDKAQAFLSKELGTIRTNLNLKFDLKKAVWKFALNQAKIFSLFKELDFFSLLKRWQKINNHAEFSNEETKGVRDFKYFIIQSNKEWKNFLKQLLNESEVAFTKKNQFWAFSWKKGRAYIVEEEKHQKTILNWVKKGQYKKIGYGLKELYKDLKKNYKVLFEGMFFDVKIAYYLLHSGEKIEWEKIIMDELGEYIKKTKGQLGFVFFDEESKKNLCRKVDYIWKLKNKLSSELEKIAQDSHSKNNLQKVFQDIEMPLVKVLAEIELTGIKVNPVILEGVNKKVSQQIENLEKQIYKIAGKKFNLNSPLQLSEVLFKDLHLSTENIKKTQNGFSTAASELKKLEGKHKIIKKVEEYRELFKLKTTYLDTFPSLIENDGRIHTTFNQTATATGRLSSENPNLQNIPIRTSLGKLIRTAFEAKQGYKLISLDYSQIELRVAAHLSQDKKMINIFQEGQDIHQATAAEIHHIPLSKVTQSLRRSAKALNFGVIYGMSVYGFAQSAGISQDDAKKFITEYMKKFSKVAELIKKIKENARKKGYVETETGRRRYIPEINSPNFQVRSAAERMAVNMPLQGLAADIMKMAMIKVFNYLKVVSDAQMVLQIHDEIILEISEKKAEKIAQQVKSIMENVYPLRVPLIVNTRIGDNWGEL